MSFGAGKGVTTLGLWACSTGFMRLLIKKNITKKEHTPMPRMILRSTFRIRIKLWSSLLFLLFLKLGFVLRRAPSSPLSVVDLILLRALLRLLPAIWGWASANQLFICSAFDRRSKSNGLEVLRRRKDWWSWSSPRPELGVGKWTKAAPDVGLV